VSGTEELIARLSTELKPLRRVLSPTRSLLVWLGAGLIYVLAMTALAGHSGLVGVAPVFMAQEVAAAVVAISAAYSAFLSVLPDRRPRGWVVVTTVAACVWLVLLAAASGAEYAANGVLGGLARETDWPCVISMLVAGTVLAGLTIAMARRGAPLAPRQTVALAALAAAAVGSLEACISRPHSFVSTILLWIGATATLLLLALVANTARFMSWHRSYARSSSHTR